MRLVRESSVCALLGLSLLCGGAAAQGNILIDIGRGPVVVHVPPTYDPLVPAPLIMLLHGYGSSGASTEQYFKLTALSDQLGFLYTYPDGTTNPGGFRFWNATDACCNFYGSTVDDSGYLLALVDEIKVQLNVDARRVYSAGHSNGGFMSYRLACDHPDTFAAIASLAGATFSNPASCAPGSRVHVLQIHGTSDTVIQYGGGTILNNPYPGAVATVQQWAAFASCSLTAVAGPNLDLVANIPGAETTVARYETACLTGGSAELWTMNGGSHVPQLSAQFAPLVVDFLLAHPKPDPGTAYCTAKTNSCGSLPAITATGFPSASATSGYVVSASNARAGKLGLLLYTDQGKRIPPVPFGQGGLLCIGGVSRGLVVPSGGTVGACDGSLALDVNAFASGALGGNPKSFLGVPGVQIDCQWWGRDTQAHGAFLSDALGFLVGP